MHKTGGVGVEECPVICDKVYKIVMRPAMMYGQCHCLLTKRQEAKVEVLTFSLVVSRMDWRGEQFGDKVIIETCLRWFRRAESGHMGQRMQKEYLRGGSGY